MIYRAFLLSTQVALISLKNWTSLTVPGVSKKIVSEKIYIQSAYEIATAIHLT